MEQVDGKSYSIKNHDKNNIFELWVLKIQIKILTNILYIDALSLSTPGIIL